MKEKSTCTVELPVRQNEKIDDLCEKTGLKKCFLLKTIVDRGLPLVRIDLKPLMEAKS